MTTLQPPLPPDSAARELLRISLDAAPVGIAMFDREMRYLASSRRYRELLDSADQSLTGRSYYDVWPDSPQQWKHVHRYCLAGETARAEAAPYRRANGEQRYWQWEIRPWHTETGSVGGLVMFCNDVTPAVRHAATDWDATDWDAGDWDAGDAKLHDFATGTSAGVCMQDIEPYRDAQEAARVAEADLHAIVQVGPGVLYRCRMRRGRMQLISVQGDTARLTGTTAADRDNGAEVLALLTLPASQTLLQRLESEAGLQATSTDIRVVRDDGAPRWVRNNAQAIRRAGDAVEIVGYLTDVTVETEEAEHLQRVSTLVTLGEMATGMAHELRQPLSSISYAAQNAEMQLNSESADLSFVGKKLTKIVSETRRASLLLDHLKLFGRNDSRPMAPVRWHDALDGALELLGPRLRAHKVHAALPATLPPVMGTQILMEQVLVNLIGNAMDAYDSQSAPPPGLEHDIVVEGEAFGDTVVLRVGDHAGGIPPAVLGRVFEPFFTTKAPGKGTGLGLSVSFGTVSAMGGTLSAYNRSGGAVLEIRAPSAMARVPATADA